MDQQRNGQSLVEVLIAVAIGTILITAAVTLIVPALQSNTQAVKVQAASSLGKELVDNVRVWSEGNWNNLLLLATGTAETYYLNTTSSPFTATVASSVQSLVVGTTTYERYFYLSDVYRDSGGNIVTATSTGATYDPSTKQVTIGYNWLGGPATNTMTTYIVRARNNVVAQNDWSGGSGQSGPETSTNNRFASSSNINYQAVTGVISVGVGIVGGGGSSLNGYSHERSITVPYANVSGTLAYFPMLVSGTYSWLAASGGYVQSQNGYDVIFTSDSGCATKLNWEVESYSSSTGAVNYWVRIPSLSNTVDTVIYVCYGNSSITTDQSNKTGTWDANYKGVWHLPNGTSLTANDSTSNGNNGTVNGALTAGTGQIDGDAESFGTSKWIELTNNSGLDISGGSWTMEAWIRPSSFVQYSGIEILNNEGLTESKNPPCIIHGGNCITTAATSLSLSNWTHIVGVYTGGVGTIYINGSNNNGTLVGDSGYGLGSTYRIGRGYSPDGYDYAGKLDEVRVSNIARSSSWILTEYNNQFSPSTFYNVGSQI